MTQDIMQLVDEYAAKAGMTLAKPTLANCERHEQARAAVIAALEDLTKDAERDVLEQAARRCEAKHVNGNWRYDTRYECAAAIREMIKEIE